MSGPAVGLQTIFGTGVETAFNTAVTTDRFFEILSESLERKNRILTSKGLRGGVRNLKRGSRRVLSARDGAGSVTMEVPTTTFGRWLQQTLGGTSTIAQQGTTPAWLQTHQLGDLTGKSQTIQKQIRDAAGNEIESFTFTGCKVLSAEFSISVDEILTATFDVDAADVKTDVAPAAASYSNLKLFHFAQGVLKVGGVDVAAVTTAKTKVASALNTNRFYVGSAGVKKEQTDNDFPEATGTLSAEFNSPADFYDRFADDSPATLVLEFEGAVISGAEKELFRITVPEVRFLGDTPKVSGPAVVVQDVPFEGAYDGALAGVKIEYKSTDTAI